MDRAVDEDADAGEAVAVVKEVGLGGDVVRGAVLGAVGESQIPSIPEFLDDAEHVVPATGIVPAGVIAQLVEDLVHLEGAEDGLDEDGGADRSARDADGVLRGVEDVIP